MCWLGQPWNIGARLLTLQSGEGTWVDLVLARQALTFLSALVYKSSAHGLITGS